MKNIYKTYMALALAGILTNLDNEFYLNKNEKLTKEEKKRIKKEYERKRMFKKGLKEFEIEGYKIIALNYKNALRKYNNKIKNK